MTQTPQLREPTKLSFNREQLESFLEQIDPRQTQWNFIALKDDKRLPDAEKQVRVLHGTVNNLWAKLTQLNRRRFAISLMVNYSDPRELKKGDVKRVRAIWRDVDSPDDKPTHELPLEPSIVVKTSAPQHKVHEYWLIAEEDVDRGVPSVEEAEAAMRIILRDYGGDPGAFDASRKLRVPGFFHMKMDPDRGLLGHPFPVTWRPVGKSEYRWAEILHAFNIDPRRLKFTSPASMVEGGMLSKYQEPWFALRVHSALSALDPDCEYDEWVRVGMAVHTLGTQQNDDYYGLFDAWSSQGSKYPGEGTIRKHWTSFSHGGVSGGTLFYLSSQTDPEWEPSIWDAVAALNTRYAMVQNQGSRSLMRFIHPSEVDYSWSAATPYPMRFSKTDLSERLANQRLDGKPILPAWLTAANRKTVKRIGFEPDQTPLSVLSDGTYNTWVGFKDPGYRGSWSILDEHLYWNICDGDEYIYNWILDWYAQTLQNPGFKPGSCLVLRGAEGVGKGVFARLAGNMFNPYTIHLTSEEQLTGDFNAHLSRSLYVFADEIIWSGNRKHRGPLYALITEQTINIRRMFTDYEPEPNHSRVVISTNEQWAVPTTLEARRFLVLDVGQGNRRDTKFFKELTYEMESGGYGGLFHDLKGRTVTSDLARPPVTKALNEVKAFSLPPHIQWWVQAVTDQEFPFMSELDGVHWGSEVRAKILFTQSYQPWMIQHGRVRELATSATQLIKHITPVCPRLKEFRNPLDQGRLTWHIPDIRTCINSLEKAGVSIS